LNEFNSKDPNKSEAAGKFGSTEVVFRNLEPSVDGLVSTCNSYKEVGRSWCCRIPRGNAVMTERWRTSLEM
jgi:hypothetical protein